MGIPVYFKTLIKDYENTILKKDKLTLCNSLFLDLNCAIHPCCQGETDETIMIQKIIQKIEDLIEYTQVKDLLYIAIDGIPPKGKMKQQRMRRHKSVLEGKSWDTNAISPGTYFMNQLNHRLQSFTNDSVKQIIISDSTERGEGEHKILQYIKDLISKGIFIIPNSSKTKKEIDSFNKELDEDLPFIMPVEDIFTISGRGTVVTGRIERGVVNLNDKVEIVGLKDTEETVVTGIEMFRKNLDRGQAGDNAGLLLRGVDRDSVDRGQVLSAPGSINPHTGFEAELYILSKEEGGRHTPFFNGYRPQFYFRTTDVTGIMNLPEGTEMVMPGDNITISVQLTKPIAMEEQLRFAIREGGKTVGSGVVTKIIE